MLTKIIVALFIVGGSTVFANACLEEAFEPFATEAGRFLTKAEGNADSLKYKILLPPRSIEGGKKIEFTIEYSYLEEGERTGRIGYSTVKSKGCKGLKVDLG